MTTEQNIDNKEKKQPEIDETQSAPDEKISEEKPSKKSKKKSKKVGSSKGVETMFRNAYRTELEIIALAATKVNIMISLNGFIISVMVISGAFIFSSSPEFLVPASIFLFTAASSIIFALLAASPEQVDTFGTVWEWVKAVFRRDVGIRDFRQYMLRGGDLQADDDLNLLIYSDRVRVDRDEYWSRMEEFLHDQEDVYQKMSDQLYWLGLMANRKFKLLNVSYTIFRWGLLASVISFFGIRLFSGLFGNPPIVLNLGISELTGIFEPSAVQQLSDGRLLIVEDESERAINVMTLGDDGKLVGNPATDLNVIRSFGRNLSDLEGLSTDDDGNIYAITSHSRNQDGERGSDREQLLRFRIEGNSATNIRSYTVLVDALNDSAELKRSIEAQTGELINFDALNIEGLAYYKQAKQLLIGFREPKADALSLIITIDNPADVFDNQADPQFGNPILLDLQGGGIRALSFDPVLATFLIVNEIDNDLGGHYSQLWSWSGNQSDTPELVALPGIINLDNVESIDSITFLGEPRLLLLSDEGDEETNRPAKYLMIDYNQLSR